MGVAWGNLVRKLSAIGGTKLRFFLWRSVVLFGVILALCGFILNIDSSHATEIQILLPDKNCPAPCWWGIQVNEDNEQVQTRLNKLPNARDGQGSKEFSADGERFFASYVIVSTRSKMVMQVMLDVYGLVNLGELFLQLGNPDCVRLATAQDTRLIFFYERDQIEIFTDPLPNNIRLDPTTPIRSIQYDPSAPPACEAWHGFTWLSRYIGR